jgi:hypothetical protein
MPFAVGFTGSKVTYYGFHWLTLLLLVFRPSIVHEGLWNQERGLLWESLLFLGMLVCSSFSYYLVCHSEPGYADEFFLKQSDAMEEGREAPQDTAEEGETDSSLPLTAHMEIVRSDLEEVAEDRRDDDTHALGSGSEEHKILTEDGREHVNGEGREEGAIMIAKKMPPCKHCGVIGPLRSHHCKYCDRCVLTFDHHCFWIGGCVGEKNHRLFWWFLFFESICLCWIFAICVRSFTEQETFILFLRENIHILFLMISSIVMSFFVVSLLFMHTYLICSNQTTFEILRSMAIPYLEDWSEDAISPFDEGCFKNIATFCWKKNKSNDPFPWIMPKSLPSKRRMDLCKNSYYECC